MSSEPYEPQILRDFLRKVQRDDEIELASASASVAASNVTSPQSPPPAVSSFLAPGVHHGLSHGVAYPTNSASTPVIPTANSIPEDDPENAEYCDPAAAFSKPPVFHHVPPAASSASTVTAREAGPSHGFSNPLHFSAYQIPGNVPSNSGGNSSSFVAEQHHFDPKALGIRPRNEREPAGRLRITLSGQYLFKI